MPGRFFSARQPLQYQEPIGGNAQTGVMVKASPVPAFVVSEAKFLLQLLTVALNAPTSLDRPDHFLPSQMTGLITEPVVLGFIGTFRPFNDEPLLLTRLVAMGRVNAQTSKP
jgi:hypothetical protein